MKEKIMAIIPARGGSKGLPRKNIRLLCGKPLIAWTIKEALRSRFITRVIVSTDDKEIAQVAKKYGAEVPFMRPVDIAQDLSTDIEFIIHALETLRDDENYEPDIILRLAPTSPLRTSKDIDQCIEHLLKHRPLDSVRAITVASKHPYKMWSITEDDKRIRPFFSNKITGYTNPYDQPRQIMPHAYTHGAIDVTRMRTLKKYKAVSGPNIGYVIIPQEAALDIDDEIDFELANIYLRKRLKYI